MSPVTTFDTFSHEIVGVATGTVFVRRAGRGPAVLLLHGDPETSLAWRKVAPEEGSRAAKRKRTVAHLPTALGREGAKAAKRSSRSVTPTLL
jgi:hypothetical protein